VIKWFFRWAFRVFILLIILVVAGLLLMDTIVREYAEYQIRSQTGMETRIGKLRVGLLNPGLTVENMVLYNSAAFGGSPFIEMRELHVEYDRDALIARKLHCKLVRFNLSQINLVEDKNGKRNFEKMEAMAQPGQTTKNGRPIKNLSGVEFTGIDTLNLTLGKVTYLRMNDPQKRDEFKMNVDHQIFTNVKTEQDFQSDLVIALLRSGANLFQNNSNGQNLLQLFSPPKK
jgi:uncharacterized protein involved in outer membrane biogenesis